MRIYGYVREIASLVFRTAVGNKEVSITPATQTGSSPVALTIPDAAASSDVLVLAAANQTLTNKSLTSPTITGTGAIAGTFTGNLTGNVTGNADTATNATNATNATTATTAGNVSGIVAGANGGTGINNSGKTVTLGGNLTTAGAFNTTLTASNTTNVTLPTTGTLTTLDGNETLTNKVISSGAVTGSARVHVPTGSTAQLASGLTTTGSVGFDTSLTKLAVFNGTSVVTVGSGSGSGSGEVNAVLNPSAAENTDGYAAGTGHSVTRDITNSPLSPITTTALAATCSATQSEASTSGVSYAITTLPASLTNKKLKCEFYVAVPAVGTWSLSVYAGATRLSLSTDSSGATILPNGVTGKFTTYFDTTNATAYSVRLTQTAGTPGVLYFTSLIVGPGIQPQGAVVGSETSFTPSFANITLGNGTPTGFWRRVGSNMEINAHLLWGSTTSCSGIVTFTVPLGLTIDIAKTAYGTVSTGAMTCGIVSTYDSNTGEEYSGNAYIDSTTTIGLAVNYAITATFVYAGNLVNANNPTTWATNDRLDVKVSIPIAEWAGSGIVNLAQADSQEIVIAYNSVADSGQALSTFNTVEFNTETVDSAGRFASNTFTVVNAGYYQLDTSVKLIAGTGLGRVILSVYKNGAEEIRLADLPAVGAGAGIDVAVSGSTSLRLVAGDAITVRVFATGTGTYTIGAGSDATRISVKRVSVDGQVIGFGLASSTASGLVSGEESGTFTAGFTGITASTMNVTVNYARVGKIVTLYFPTSLAAANAASNSSAVAAASVPTSIRPSGSLSSGYQVKVWAVSNSVDTTTDGYCLVGNNGNITISRDLANTAFANTGSNGWNAFSLTYLIS